MSTETRHLNIKHIDIEELFGIYTYSVPMDNVDISKLLILYGDNGAGKTTILQIVFNLLSSEDGQGHKTELANTKFKKVSITLSNNYVISAYRKSKLLGKYELLLKLDEKTIAAATCNVLERDNRYSVNSNVKGYQDVDKFLAVVENINLSIHYLSDERKIKTTINMLLNEKNDEFKLLNFPSEIINNVKKGNNSRTFSFSDAYLKASIQRVEEWFRNQTRLGNSVGQDSINSIYFSLIEKLLDDDKKTDNHLPKITKNEILSSLEKLNERNREFIKYNLTVDYNLDKYIQIIQKTSISKLKIVDNTLRPYIEGIEKKLNAIENTKNIIDTFVTSLNNFYTGKKIEYSVDNGLNIMSTYNKDERLTPTMLSSGEKQLLLLFCNTITAKEHASIFIIDEPELSLNVKWQRKLIEALLSFSEGSSIQFILASHSIELLTKYKNNVCKLVNIKEL